MPPEFIAIAIEKVAAFDGAYRRSPSSAEFSSEGFAHIEYRRAGAWGGLTDFQGCRSELVQAAFHLHPTKLGRWHSSGARFGALPFF